jgi:signal transduction histidine kinase
MLLGYSLITLAGATLLAALAGRIVAGQVLRPIHRITEAARSASEHNLSTRVSLRGPRDELRELADTFDTMLDRLKTAFESQQRFIANAGHELRTPLTVMRTTLDVMLSEPTSTASELRHMGQDVRAVVTDAEQLIGALLTLARNEHGLSVREPVDLATVTEDVLDSTDRGTAG